MRPRENTKPRAGTEALVGRATKLAASYRHALAIYREEKRRLAETTVLLADTKTAQEIAQAVAQLVQEQAHGKIAGIVTKCLRAVWPEDPPGFEIHFERKRGKTEARMVFTRAGEEYSPDDDESSGGQIDVAAYALRVAAIVLTKPRLRKLIVLDEPFRFVEADRQEAVANLLLTVAKELKIQTVLVTHAEKLKIGKVIHIR